MDNQKKVNVKDLDLGQEERLHELELHSPHVLLHNFQVLRRKIKEWISSFKDQENGVRN